MGDLVTLPPGALVIDNSFNPPTVAQLLADRRVRGEIRYASTPTTNVKNWTRAQLDERATAGIARLMIHEQTQTDHLGGRAAGRAKADVFAQVADTIGYPRTVPALVACDTSPAPIMADYAAGFDERIRQHGWLLVGAYAFGPYGIQLLLDAGVCTDVLWQAYAGSAVTGGGPDNASALEDAFRKARSMWGANVRVEQVPGFLSLIHI